MKRAKLSDEKKISLPESQKGQSTNQPIEVDDDDEFGVDIDFSAIELPGDYPTEKNEFKSPHFSWHRIFALEMEFQHLHYEQVYS